MSLSQWHHQKSQSEALTLSQTPNYPQPKPPQSQPLQQFLKVLHPVENPHQPRWMSNTMTQQHVFYLRKRKLLNLTWTRTVKWRSVLRRPKHKLVKKLTKASLSLKEEEWGVLLRIKKRKEKFGVSWPVKQNQSRLQWSRVKIRNLQFRKDPLAARVVKSLLAHLHRRPGAPHQPSLDRLTTKRLMNIDFLTRRGE